MKEKNTYGGLDRFRIIAAFLVVAIHTSPLTSFSVVADFALTRVIGRVAVPFFFMATGFFLLPDSTGQRLLPEPKRMKNFLKKTALLYGVASLFYLPVNLYAGGLGNPPYIFSLLKDIVFDGTFYHLWYFPAALLGALLLWGLLKSNRPGLVLGIAFGLYLVGLLGDSYYGMSKELAPIKALYDIIFICADYTRNGIFFAPIFLLLGGMLRGRRLPSLPICFLGLGISFILLFVEAFSLRWAQWQRHDSMYFMLLPCMIFLFQCLLHWKEEEKKGYRTFSLLLYIIHPMMIVCIRGCAKLTGLQAIFIDHSFLHFVAVMGFSCAISILIPLVWKHKKKRTVQFMTEDHRKDRAWLEVDLRQLCHNALTLQGILPEGCALMAVVKADAYGHGADKVARELNRVDVEAFAVATLAEGIRLRQAQVKGEILILGYTPASCAHFLHQYDLTQTVTEYTHARELNQTGLCLKVQVKIDTGMHRMGQDYREVNRLDQLFQLENLRILGIYTHLCVSGSDKEQGISFAKLQKRRLDWLLQQLVYLGHCLPKVHIQSSYGALCFPDWQYDYARVGIALYGACSHMDDVTKAHSELHPVLSWRTRIVQIRKVKKGETIGYSRTFQVKRDTRVAVLSVGYADGLPRALSNGQGQVLINGAYAKFLGAICMDLCMVDVTEISTAQVGTVATLIGCDGVEKITAEQMAQAAGTITNELFSRLGPRLERIYQ